MSLYAEGPTDERFLPVVIRRTAVVILGRRSSVPVEVPPPTIVERDQFAEVVGQEERVLCAARQAAEGHVLLVHADADDRSRSRAFAEKCAPGFERVADARLGGERVCAELVAVIPVRMTEAWMLADPEALADVLGGGLTPAQLELPDPPKRVESVHDPKATLHRLMREAQGRRRLRPIGVLYEPVATRVNLDRLGRVPAYAQFVKDLTSALTRTGFLPETGH